MPSSVVSKVSSISSYLAGALLVVTGVVVAKLPTWLVASDRVSLFELVEANASIMHVNMGCSGSLAALESYERDPALRAVSIPATTPPLRGAKPRFHSAVCDYGIAGLVERGYWWVSLVDHDVACTSLWGGESEFLKTHKILAWPQFSNGDVMVRSFDVGALREIGVEKVVVGDRKVYRGVATD